MARGAFIAPDEGNAVRKTMLCVLVLSSMLAGCIVVPVGRPWHHDGYADRGYWHEDGWRR